MDRRLLLAADMSIRFSIAILAACGSSPTTPPGGDDDPSHPSPHAAHVGVFAAQNSFFELDTGGASLRFHFGQNVLRWNANTDAFAGDFDGDGYDTIATIEPASGRIRIPDDNDSDEYGERGTIATIETPASPPLLAVAGDWDGDGKDGIGVYSAGTNTFYLRQTADSGAPDLVVKLDLQFKGGQPLAGDWDGDGKDELGTFDGTRAYLDTADGPRTVAARGFRAVAADFDADGIDTVAAFDRTTNEFTITDEDGGTTTQTFGVVDAGYWSWEPLAGAWHVPEAPRASAGYAWPEGGPAEHGMNAAMIANALNVAATTQDIESVLVARNGVLVAERYYHGFDRDIAGNIKSVSKSVMSALFGIAIDDGLVGGLEDTAASYLPAYFAGLPANKSTIKLDDMITMRGGLQWDQDADLPAMIASESYLAFGLAKPMIHPPGTTYLYSQVMTQMGTAILKKVAQKPVHDFARERLLERIGITIPRWDLSPEGFEVGGAEMWMRPRDLLRFGELYLRGGKLDGDQVLTPAWAARSAAPWIPEAQGRKYGMWWRERPWVNYPTDDTYFGWGYGGQFVFVFPRYDMVVVVMSKWSVSNQRSGENADAIFAFVDERLLKAVVP